uniref:Uncharacterized protein n=1 Tax=Aegilops tauschii subsp. strangulata TaxID=200361 RepID=A0A453EXJ8_AEGTS
MDSIKLHSQNNFLKNYVLKTKMHKNCLLKCWCTHWHLNKMLVYYGVGPHHHELLEQHAKEVVPLRPIFFLSMQLNNPESCCKSPWRITWTR